MTDSTTLELAAKAAGYPFSTTDERGWFRVKSDPVCEWELWDPLTDDGECARLEAALSLDVQWYPAMVLVGPYGGIAVAAYFVTHGDDRNAARRLASTKAAAEIGRSHHAG